jgi:hypothetical protein
MFWRRLRFTLLLAGGVIINGLLLALAYRAYYIWSAEQRLQAAIAAVEAQDPVWRWEDLVPQREEIPDEQNSSPHILAAAELLPRDWPTRPAAPQPHAQNGEAFHGIDSRTSDDSLLERLKELEPAERLDDQLAQELQAELTALAPALARARPVIDLPKGRHPVEWKIVFISTPLRGTNESSRVATLFELEATRQAHQGNLDEALTACRGILNAGRSIGDESTLVSQLVRYGLEGRSCKSLLRILAQGTPTAEALRTVQQALEEEARDIKPIFEFVLKAERGGFFNVFGLIATGDMTLEAISNGGSKEQNWFQRAWSWMLVRPPIWITQAAYLEKMTEIIDIARLPVTEQQEAFAQFESDLEEFKRASTAQAVGVLMIPSIRNVLSSHHRACAKLDCARTAVAAERYRLAHARWPESLAQLVPEFLEEVPPDIFGTGPLRCQRLKDGLIVYSVGPDGEEELDPLADQEAHDVVPDVGFRLWDVDHRGKRPSNQEKRNQEP